MRTCMPAGKTLSTAGLRCELNPSYAEDMRPQDYRFLALW